MGGKHARRKRLEEFKAYLGTEMNARLTKMREKAGMSSTWACGIRCDPAAASLGGPRRRGECAGESPLSEFLFEPAAQGSDRGLVPSAVRCHAGSRYRGNAVARSSEGLFIIHLCLLDVGDTALVPDPSYPSYVAGVKIAGGQVEPVPLLRENGFLPNLEAIPADVASEPG